MAQIAAYLNDEPAEVTLGSVVSLDGEYGVVWHAKRDVLRVLRLTRGMTSVPLSLANEVALHLPVSLGGWCVAYDELVAWPRSVCCVVGELDDMRLLKILDARNASDAALHPAFVAGVMSEAAASSARQ
jgi:hypothetical protein